MPNAIKMLQDDNNSVRILLGQVQMVPAGQADAEDKAALQVASMLTTHSQLEDEFITPLLVELHPELADESDSEHEQAKRLLARIKGLPAGLERRRVMAELHEVFRAHKLLQESSVIPLLLESLDVGEREALGRRMRVREQELRLEGADMTGAAETATHMIYPQL
jgi:hypothetical protein